MADLNLADLPALDSLSGDVIETLADHADDLLGLGITPNATAVLVGSLADDLLDFEELMGGPWGVALEAIDGKAITKSFAIGQAIVGYVWSPERRAERKSNRQARKAARQARRAERRSQ